MAEQAGNLDHISLSGTVCPLLHSATEQPRRQSCCCQDNHQFDHWSIQAAQNLSAQPFQRPPFQRVHFQSTFRICEPAGFRVRPWRGTRGPRHQAHVAGHGTEPRDNEGPVAILRWRLCATRPQWSCRHPTRGFLLCVDLAVPKRVPTLAQELALDQAMAARQTCGDGGRRFHFCLSKKLGCCLECHDGTRPIRVPTPLPRPRTAWPPDRTTCSKEMSP
ncbi:RRQRL motif-containing zinc-binding protein [Streptomyces sp. NBC_01336]|uniref:RRQRL motif-containing zinc-binding protein n=1 Tax=Streptomyces sp. NBC_01336 TaxID=2903829 RepID=UPI002E164F26